MRRVIWDPVYPASIRWRQSDTAAAAVWARAADADADIARFGEARRLAPGAPHQKLMPYDPLRREGEIGQ